MYCTKKEWANEVNCKNFFVEMLNVSLKRLSHLFSSSHCSILSSVGHLWSGTSVTESEYLGDTKKQLLPHFFKEKINKLLGRGVGAGVVGGHVGRERGALGKIIREIIFCVKPKRVLLLVSRPTAAAPCRPGRRAGSAPPGWGWRRARQGSGPPSGSTSAKDFPRMFLFKHRKYSNRCSRCPAPTRDPRTSAWLAAGTHQPVLLKNTVHFLPIVFFCVKILFAPGGSSPPASPPGRTRRSHPWGSSRRRRRSSPAPSPRPGCCSPPCTPAKRKILDLIQNAFEAAANSVASPSLFKVCTCGDWISFEFFFSFSCFQLHIAT